MADIGDTLRDARMRAHIDVSEIEAKTKIRAKYLRALENEEWSLLPGPTFVKSFLRTYAQALGLDGKALVEQYRVNHERPSEALLEPIVPPSQRGRARASGARGAGARAASGPSRGYVALVGAILLVIALLIYGLASGGSGSTSKRTARKPRSSATAHKTASAGGSPAATPVASTPARLVSLSLQPLGRVYVCLLGDGGRKLIPGVELAAGAATQTYRARRFQIRLGNASVLLNIDGTAKSVPPSSLPIGYTITKANGRKRLTQSQLPSCV
jgi:transcriptional regulator with XRE-family HTH domain